MRSIALAKYFCWGNLFVKQSIRSAAEPFGSDFNLKELMPAALMGMAAVCARPSSRIDSVASRSCPEELLPESWPLLFEYTAVTKLFTNKLLTHKLS